jgi:recombinational DNA repair protein RecR
MGANPDGEHTSDVVREMLQPITAKYSLATTTLGRGLSTGLELEYSDAATIKSALQNRV